MRWKTAVFVVCCVLFLSADSCDEEVPSEDTITKAESKIENIPRPEFTTSNDYIYVDKVVVEGITYHCLTNGYDTESMQCFKVEPKMTPTTSTTFR